MDRSRKLRATSRPPSEVTASANAGNGAGSSDDEDYEVCTCRWPQAPCSHIFWCFVCSCHFMLQVPSAPVPQRASTRRQPKVDFTKLDVGDGSCNLTRCLLPFGGWPTCCLYASLQAASLKKYRKLHDMDDLPPGASKEEMIPAVAKHFSQQVCCQSKLLWWSL